MQVGEIEESVECVECQGSAGDGEDVPKASRNEKMSWAIVDLASLQIPDKLSVSDL